MKPLKGDPRMSGHRNDRYTQQAVCDVIRQVLGFPFTKSQSLGAWIVVETLKLDRTPRALTQSLLTGNQ